MQPLPPSFESSLPSLPGFHATITYLLSVVVHKNKPALLRIGNPWVSQSSASCCLCPNCGLFCVICRTLSTPLVYLPRSRPPTPLPPPLHPATFTPRFDARSDWQGFTTMVKVKRPLKGALQDLEDIESKLFLHTTKIFPITQSIPFYLSFLSSPSTLAAFMPFGPQTPGSVGPSLSGYQCTRMGLMRQVIVDAKNPNLRTQTISAVQREMGRDGTSSLSGPISSSSEMWEVTTIGEGSFKLFVSLLLCFP
jgi:hypothetical protein